VDEPQHGAHRQRPEQHHDHDGEVREVLTPVDIERRFGLTGGNIFQGAMGLSQLSFMRPIPGYADYRTPVRDLWMCGAATHPGGGVMGACGYNAAREILRDARRG
jgi:phytoene dehydrogenase-like protein